jgi:hypothetical protein
MEEHEIPVKSLLLASASGGMGTVLAVQAPEPGPEVLVAASEAGAGSAKAPAIAKAPASAASLAIPVPGMRTIANQPLDHWHIGPRSHCGMCRNGVISVMEWQRLILDVSCA